MADLPLKLILGVDPLLAPLTGIGHATRQLAKGLAEHDSVEDLRLFAHGRFFDYDELVAQHRETASDNTFNTPSASVLTRLFSGLRPRLAKSALAVAVYKRLMPAFSRWRLSPLSGSHLLHSPNFVLPPFGGKKVVTFHDLSTLLYPRFHPPVRTDYVNAAMAQAVRQADHIITDCEFVRRQVLEHFKLNEDRCTAVPLGADKAFRPRRQEECEAVLTRYQLSFGDYFLFVSTIEPRKNLLRILQAYERCQDANASRMPPLVIVGDKGWNSEQEHRQIRRLSADGLVRYLGYVPLDEISALYSSARSLIFASIYEGFGLPVLEAMQSGTPVLTSSHSAMAEICGNAALLVEPEAVESIADGIERLLNDDTLVSDMRQAGLVRARAFSWERCINQTLAVYRRV